MSTVERRADDPDAPKLGWSLYQDQARILVPWWTCLRLTKRLISDTEAGIRCGKESSQTKLWKLRFVRLIWDVRSIELIENGSLRAEVWQK